MHAVVSRRADTKHELGVGPLVGCEQRVLLVLWLLRRETILTQRCRRTTFLDFDLKDEQIDVELRG